MYQASIAHNENKRNHSGFLLSADRSWHPASNQSISPLMTQILFLCATNEISEETIPHLSQALFVRSELLETVLDKLISQNSLLRYISSSHTLYRLTDSGAKALALVKTRKPEFLALTQVSLDKVIYCAS